VAKPALVGAVAALGLLLVGGLVGASGTDRSRAVTEPRIAFASARSGNRAIWSVRPDGTGAVRLTAPRTPARPCGCRSGDFDSRPAWSADGRRIAFARGARVVVMNADGSDPRVVPAPPGSEDFDPAWSVAGRLAFFRQRPAAAGTGYVHEIVSVDARGGNARPLVPVSRHAYSSFAWSPEGRRVAYAVPYDDPGSPFVVGLFVKAAGQGRPRFLLRAAGMGELAWSPDGSTVALAASVPGAEPFDPHRLFTITLVGRRIVQLTSSPFAHTADGGPRWSPDGSLVVFTRTEPRRAALYGVRPDGTGERLLVADAQGAAFAPGGRRVAFVEGVTGRGRQLALGIATFPGLRVQARLPLSRPLDADGLGAQAWRPSAR
jgi:Tol biopolymer transport system component